jgi:hypothetical protein
MTIDATRRHRCLDLIVASLFGPAASFFRPSPPPLEDAASIKRPHPSPGLAPHGDALAIALEKSHPSSDGGGTINGVVVNVRDVDPAPGVHTEQSQAPIAAPAR